jgi:hypothetical protein
VIEPQNTCDVYRREVARMIESGDTNSLAMMVKTWYSRCDFGKSFDGRPIEALGVRENGVVWIETHSGIAEYCQEKSRWRLVTAHDESGDAEECIYAMARIAEVTHVPFAYLSGVRDAVAIIEKQTRERLSKNVSELSHENRRLSEEVRKKSIAVDAVFVKLGGSGTASRLLSRDYPDPPAGTLSLRELKAAFKKSSGVYFAWEKWRVVYVGATQAGAQSRFNSKHCSVSTSDRLSFVEMPEREVFFAECHYIAKYAPERNACVAEALGKKEAAKRGKRRAKKESKEKTKTVQVGQAAC